MEKEKQELASEKHAAEYAKNEVEQKLARKDDKMKVENVNTVNSAYNVVVISTSIDTLLAKCTRNYYTISHISYPRAFNIFFVLFTPYGKSLKQFEEIFTLKNGNHVI